MKGDSQDAKQQLSVGTALSQQQLVNTTRRLFDVKTWLREFGTPAYALHTLAYVTRLCRQQKLPAGWSSIYRKHHFIFHPVGSEVVRSTHPEGWQPRLTDEEVKRLQRLGRRGGLERGDLTRWAKAYGVSLSQISRIVHGQRRAARGRAARRPERLDATRLAEIAVEPRLIRAVFARVLAPSEWHALLAPRYGIHAMQTVYDYSHQDRLPDDWHAVAIGEHLLIYHASLQVRSHWGAISELDRRRKSDNTDGK